MDRYKSTPDDDRIVQDEAAKPLDRVSAMARLAFDQFHEFEPVFAELLCHPSEPLREQAVISLVGTWRLPQYLDTAIQMLHTDPIWYVRTSAALALRTYVQRTGQQRERICLELTRCVLHDPDTSVQKLCYAELLQLLAPERDWSELPDDFERERDVDWPLLQPYLDQLQPK